MEYIACAKSKVPVKYKKLKQYKTIMDSYDPEILHDYNETMRWNLLKYVLNDPCEWIRLKIQTFPAEYPVIIVRAPVPWHINFEVGQQLLFRHYFVGNPILLRIRDLWLNE